MSNTDKVRAGVDANIVEANLVQGHDGILTGNPPENISLSPGRNEADDTTSLLTIWSRSDGNDDQVLDLRHGTTFGTAFRAQLLVNDLDPTGVVTAVSGSLLIEAGATPRLWQNLDGATDWKVISDDLGNESLEETLVIGNVTGNLPLIVSDQPLAAIQGEDSTDSTGGGVLLLRGGNEAGAVGNGGDVTINTGTSVGGNTGNLAFTTAGNATTGATGAASIGTGASTGGGDGGFITLNAGSGAQGGEINANAGAGFAAGNRGGRVQLFAGDSFTDGDGGSINIVAGSASTPPVITNIFTPGEGGNVNIFSGNSAGTEPGGAIGLLAGDGGSGGAAGGDVFLVPGSGGGGGSEGEVVATANFRSDNLKRGTTDPNVASLAGNEGDVYQRTLGGIGQIWVNTNGTSTGWRLVAFAGSLVDSLTKIQQGFITPAGDTNLLDTVGLFNGAVTFTGGTGTVAKSPSPLDSPAVLMSAAGGGANSAGIHMPNPEPRTQRQHRFVAAFKFATISIFSFDNRAFIGMTNLDGPTMIASDTPAGQYAGLMKQGTADQWTFVARGPSGLGSTQTFAYSTTNDTAHYLILDFSDAAGDDIVATLLDDDFNLIDTKTWTTTSGPDTGRGPTSLINLAPVVGVTADVATQDAISMLSHLSSVVTEADKFTEGGGGGGGIPTLEAVLATGNFSGANSIVLTDFDGSLGGILSGELDPPLNLPDGGRVTISGGGTTDLTGTGGDLSLFSGLPAIGAAFKSGDVLLASGNVLDVTNTGGTGEVLVTTGSTTGAGATGNLLLETGSSTTGASGDVFLRSTTSTGTVSGDVSISTGAAGTSAGLIILTGGNASAGSGGSITITGGDGGGLGGLGGDIGLFAGDPDPASASIGGGIIFTSSDGATTEAGGAITGTAGDGGGASGKGGDITWRAGDATGGVADGGDVVLNPGAGFGGGVSGQVIVNGKLTVTGLIDPTGLVLNGQGVAPVVPDEGEGLLWVDNTGVATVLKFTNDLGGTTILGDGGGGDLATVLAFGNESNDIPIRGQDKLPAGGDLELEGGEATGGGGSGGGVLITAGDPFASGDGPGGLVTILAADGDGTGAGGAVSVTTGGGDIGAAVGGTGGTLTLATGVGGTDNSGGALNILTGAGSGAGTGGDLNATLGASGTTGGATPGSFIFIAGAGGIGSGDAGGAFNATGGAGDTTGDGGDLTFTGGAGGAGGGDGGDINLVVGTADGGGTDGVFAVTGDASFSNTLLVGGATVTDADDSANDIVAGAGDAVARGITFVGTTVSNMSIAFSDGTLTRRGEIRLENSATPDRWVFRIANVDRMALDTTFFSPTTDAALGVGDVTSSGWNSLALTERADHVGTPTGTRAEVWLINTATQSLMFTDDAGADWQIGGDTQTVNTILVAGAAVADADSGYDDIVIGAGGANARGVTFNVASGTDSGLAWNDGTNQLDGYFAYGGSGFQFRLNNLLRYNMATTRFEPVAGQDIGLGRTQNEGWAALALAERADHIGTPTATRAEVWLANTATQSLMLTDDAGNDWQIGGDTQTANTILLAGATAGDAHASYDEQIIGDGAATSRGLTFYSASGTYSGVAWNDGINTNDGVIEYNGVSFRIRANGTSRLSIDGNGIRPFAGQSLDLGITSTEGWTSLALTERADHVGTPTASRGEVWLLGPGTQALMLTDDAGNDWKIGGDMQTVNTILVAGAASGDAAAGFDEIVVGDGSANDFGGTFFFTLGNRGGWAWNDGINQKDGAFDYDGFAFRMRTQNVERFEFNETEAKPLVAGIKLGGPAAAQRWGPSYLNQVIRGVELSAGTITADDEDVIMVDASGATVDVDLPTAIEGLNYELVVKDISNTVTVNASSGDVVNGAASQEIFAVGRYFVTAEDITNWHMHGPVPLSLGQSQYSRVTGDNGAGSGNTNILRWDTEVESGGTDITYTDDSVNGGYWTIGAAGTYSISFTGMASGVQAFAVNVASALSDTFDAAHIRQARTSAGASNFSCTWVGFVPSGWVVWASTDAGSLSVSTNQNQVSVTRVA